MTQLERIQRALEAHGARIPWRHRRVQRLAKRALDLAIAVPAAVVALPVMGAVAAAVRATSAGPVFFRQTRVGLDGRPFTMWKFRTMRVERPDGSVVARGEVTRSDPRLTPIGAVLRDWRLDELPQLFQVLRGDMSLVGPRPDLEANLHAYADGHLVRFGMPPGCTAWTFTRGAFANDWATRQRINVDYVYNWRPMLDLEILFGTVRVLLVQEATAPEVAEVAGASS